jgi:maltose/moltooligosaccharide transporter
MMKLNYKKTFFVGLAFLIISMFWQAYDTIIPKILVNKFGMGQALSGFIMALDNILALFMLPLFGHISDRCKARIGKRTPYIIVGTVLAAVFFFGLTFADNAQLAKIQGIDNNSVLIESEILDSPSLKVDGKQIKDALAADGLSLEDFENITEDTKIEGVDLFTKYVIPARNAYAWKMTAGSPVILIAFIGLLLFVLVSMSIYRSPAVALMPDVTIKPLRSKANAVINLMGAIGGAIVIILGMAYKADAPFGYISYTLFFGTVSALMLLFLALFLFKVKEPRLSEEYRRNMIKYNIDGEECEDGSGEKLPKDKLRSLLFILASVFLWFMAYNAVTSKFSVYAGNVLGMGFFLPLLLAQVSAIVAFIPIGIIASKFGRKKTILVGVTMLTAAFFLAYFIGRDVPQFLMYLIFVLAGLAWTTINVNSYPMVVELAKGGNVGRYTGFYYTASMAAQILTPILSGALMDLTSMRALFPYAAVFAALAFVTMLFVKHGDNKPPAKKGIEAYDAE